MANLIKFESIKTIEKNRDDLREARSKVIKDAKDKYEKEERKKEAAKKRGEDKWMLASVNHRLNAEEEMLKVSKKKKKEKHRKQKEKKKKKKKKKESSSSSDSTSDDEEAQWVVKGDKKKEESSQPTQGAVRGPRLERDSWMSAPLDLVPTLTRQDLIDKKNKEKQELEEQKRLLEQPGQHAKELNPYWKDGGTGVPEENSKTKLVTKGTGDSGLSWLRKSYQRCVEQAKEEGRSLEDLASERWGSLEKIQSMIKEAEKLAGVSRRDEVRKNRFMRPGEGSRSDRDGMRSDSHHSKSRRSRSQSPKRHSNSSDKRSTSRERNHRNKSRSQSRDRHKRSNSREKEHRKRSRSRNRSKRERSTSKEKQRHERSKSRDRYRRERSRSHDRQRNRSRSQDRISSSSSSMKGRFMKPGEMSENGSISSYRTSSKSGSSSAGPAWKKKEFHKPVEEDDEKDREKEKERERRNEREKERRKRRKSSDSSSSDSSSSTSDSSDSDTEKGQRSRSEEAKVTQKVLTETEMNALGAKILKAEIMGNKEQAEKLKSQLEAAREARKNKPAGGSEQAEKLKSQLEAAREARKNMPAGGVSEKREEEREDFIVLTRTDRSGMARPVPESKHDRESHSGKRRKKQKVETHTGKEGERVRYFADDDQFDLKTLVEREKMGTAEDQNAMFSRLAGRAMKTQGDDFQVDDIFLSKANKKQAESVEEERDRARAIMEHKQMASSMEKCHFCFAKVEKHLIVAIGAKVYLSLPATKSLTEGHCLIVPMQHVASATTVDEDVWSEIQLFRKTLTKMFNDRDEDVVFMETSMKLKYFPHMCIEVVPFDREVGDTAPIYFKKAIQETGSEWAENKKVVDISQKDIRHAVPKGFPYFSVDFGNEGGFAHVIEDERTFPAYFGKEIIGGMIDADHSLWRKPHKENFDAQRKKVLRFSEMWKPYDWTQNLSKSTQSDSSSDSD